MGTVKPWQIVVIVVALLGAGVLVFLSLSGGGNTPDQASDATMVDIQTGELFVARYPDKRPVSFPATNPSSKQASLYPAMLKEGKWQVKTRYLSDVRKNKALKADLIVDAKTGEIKPTSDSPRRDNQIFGE